MKKELSYFDTVIMIDEVKKYFDLFIKELGWKYYYNILKNYTLLVLRSIYLLTIIFLGLYQTFLLRYKKLRKSKVH